MPFREVFAQGLPDVVPLTINPTWYRGVRGTDDRPGDPLPAAAAGNLEIGPRRRGAPRGQAQSRSGPQRRQPARLCAALPDLHPGPAGRDRPALAAAGGRDHQSQYVAGRDNPAARPRQADGRRACSPPTARSSEAPPPWWSCAGSAREGLHAGTTSPTRHPPDTDGTGGAVIPMPFEGFDPPESNFWRLPNNWFDLVSHFTSWAEHKVVEYILRHTWGYHEYGVGQADHHG